MDSTRLTHPVELDRATDLAPLWTEFHATACASARKRIIDFYLPFARILAAKLYAKRTYMELEFMDYFQFASIGLVEAVDRYDPSRGAKFETFAAHRINGAILNGIESLSERQEQIAAKRRMTDRLESLADEQEKSKESTELFRHLAELAIGLAVGFMLEDSGMYQAEEALYPDNTYRSVEIKQLRRRILELIEHLPTNEKRVIKYHYLQQIAFEEIGRILGVTKGRVSQIHKDALIRLRNSMQCNGDLDLRC